MRLKKWYQNRGLRFSLKRGSTLIRRYGFTSAMAIARVEDCVNALSQYNCSPTFFVPAIVARHNLRFIKSLQAKGCEIGVHGYNHVDIKAYTPEDGTSQLIRAKELLESNGIDIHGFRCPYLSASDALVQAISPGLFKYSSNKAVEWPHEQGHNRAGNLLFTTIGKFYQPVDAERFLCLPYMNNGLVELPIFVPDDLQLRDGLSYSLEQISKVWVDMLHQTYNRGEFCNLMFHTELAAYVAAPSTLVLREASSFEPKVWITRLREVCNWWLEREKFDVEITPRQGGCVLHFKNTPRATLLYRGFEPGVLSVGWYEVYSRLLTDNVPVEGPRLPFIGLPSDASDWVKQSLKRMGYIVLSGEEGLRCSLYLDKGCLRLFDQPVELIAYIESLNVPMIRYWPWPDGMRSVLCITGDLDALSLMDYASRLFVH